MACWKCGAAECQQHGTDPAEVIAHGITSGQIPVTGTLSVVHIAGEPEGLIQKCSRCGYILADYRNAMGAGDWCQSWWAWPHGAVTVEMGNPIRSEAGAQPGAIPCNQRPS